MLPRVDLPAPLGPMMACTWPGCSSSDRPLRMSLPATRAWRLSIFSIVVSFANFVWPAGAAGRGSADRAFQRHFQQLLGFHRELHRQLAEDLLAEAVDDHRDRVFLADAAAAAIEQLVVADLGGGGLVLDGGAGVLHLHVGEGVGAAALADQQAVALGVVAGAFGPALDLDQAAVGVLAAAGADALADDLALGARAQVDHLGAGVGLLVVVGQRHRVEL